MRATKEAVVGREWKREEQQLVRSGGGRQGHVVWPVVRTVKPKCGFLFEWITTEQGNGITQFML